MEKNLIQKQGGQMSAAKAEKKTMQAYIKAMAPAIQKALPSVITPERFTRMVLSALSATPKLAECSPQSFLAAMMTAAQLGVEPNTALGQAYLLPYRNHGNMECQFQLGYKGLIDLAYRSGEVSVIQAHTVHENDVFDYELGMDPKLRHVPAKADRGEAVAYYAMFKTKDGGYGFEVMSVDDVQRHAQRYSKSYGSGSSPWRSNFDEMAKKTVLKRALKYAPLKSDFVRGVAQDETIKAELSDEMYAVPDETVYEAEGEEIGSTAVDAETGEVIGDAE
jgi:recombination protein RecT